MLESISRREEGALGSEVSVLDTCATTQFEARQRARSGAPHGALVIARRQEQGHGRRGRAWFSEPGGLYFSLVLRPTGLEPRLLPRLTLLAGAGLLDGLLELEVDALIKWPNDLLIPAASAGPLGAFRKVGGVILEPLLSGDVVEAAILGVGVNVRPPRGGFPEELTDIAGTLADAGVSAAPEEVLHVLLDGMEPWLEHPEDDAHFERCLEHLRERSASVGRPVRVDANGQSVTGLAEGFDSDGALLVRKDDGDLERVLIGDVWPA